MGIKGFLARNREAIATVRWFFNDFFFRYRYEIIFITALGAGAAAIQASILVALNRVVTRGMPTEIAYWISTNHASLAFGVGLVVLLSASAYLSYLNSRRTLSLWPRYQGHALGALFSALQAASQREIIDAASIKNSAFSKVLHSTLRLGAFSRIVTKSILPALRFVAFCAYAVISNPIATLFIFMIVFPLSGIALVFFSRRAAQCDRAAESIAQEATKEIDSQVKASLSFPRLEPGSDTSAIGVNFATRIDHLVNRFVWVEMARLVTGLITILMLGGLIALVGESADVKWGEFLIYLLSLMLAFIQLSGLTSAVSSFGSFYPTVLRHRQMLLALQTAESRQEFHTALRRAGLDGRVPAGGENNNLE